jgi:hypothetical protein
VDAVERRDGGEASPLELRGVRRRHHHHLARDLDHDLVKLRVEDVRCAGGRGQRLRESALGVLANYVYNALLTGRPYLFDLVEDAETAVRFSRERLGAKSVAVAGTHHLARVIAAAVPGLELRPAAAGEVPFSWRAAVKDMEESWPIHYLVPGGASLRLDP